MNKRDVTKEMKPLGSACPCWDCFQMKTSAQIPLNSLIEQVKETKKGSIRELLEVMEPGNGLRTCAPVSSSYICRVQEALVLFPALSSCVLSLVPVVLETPTQDNKLNLSFCRQPCIPQTMSAGLVEGLETQVNETVTLPSQSLPPRVGDRYSGG